MRIIALIAVISIVVLIGGIRLLIQKARMRRALGRNVSTSDVTSLNAWMEVSEKEHPGS